MAYAQTGQFIFRQTTGNSFFITATSVSAAYLINQGQSFKFTHMGSSDGNNLNSANVCLKWGNSNVVAVYPVYDGTERPGDILPPGVVSVLSRPAGVDYSGKYIAFIVLGSSTPQIICVTPGEGE